MRKLQNDELNRKSVDEFRQADKSPLVIVLDNIRSQHNIGSVFRTCDAFLVEAVYLCGITAKPPHREIHKTALGAEDSVQWHYSGETVPVIEELRRQGYMIAAVEQTENSIMLQDVRYTGQKLALVFGNEVKGVDQRVVALCDFSIEIPQFGTKHSFNISVSAGIVLWHLYHQGLLLRR